MSTPPSSSTATFPTTPLTPSHDYLSAGIPSDLNSNILKDRSISSSSSQQQSSSHYSNQQSNGSGSKDKKWKQMFKFGSMGRKTSAGSVTAVNGFTSSNDNNGPASPKERAEGASAGGNSPFQGWSTSPINSNHQSSFGAAPVLPPTTTFKPIMGSTIVADPASFSNDSMSSDGGATRSSQMEHLTSTSGSMSKGDETMHPSSRAHMQLLQPSVDVVEDGKGTLAVKLPLTPSSASNNTSANGGGSSFASKLLRRVSSAPDYNKLMANNSNNGIDHSTPPGRSNDMLDSPTTAAEPDAIYFPGSPVRMDSNARSFSSKDFEKARNPSGKSSHNTPKTKGVITFPGKKSASAKATMTDSRSQVLGMPSSAGPLASLQGDSPNGAPRTQFRRTYSSNSIKVREVEVGPNSFSKVKMLGKGDVGKVYLVREKKTEKLFAMKGEFENVLAGTGCS
jgi:protein-serine/threonine kinase